MNCGDIEENPGGSTISLAGCGIWLISMAGFGMRVKNRSGKRDFKYKRERDNVPVDLTGDVGHSVGDADDGDEYESSSSAEEEEFQQDESISSCFE